MFRDTPYRATGKLLAAISACMLIAGAAMAAHHTIAERVASESRSDSDRERDAGRKPAEVLEFLGLEAGMDAVDIMAAGGWYTEVLAHAVGEDGSVAAQNPDFILQFRDGANDKALSERMSDDRLPNVHRLDKDFDELGSDDGEFDLALSALNFHDIYNANGRDAAISMLEQVKSILKPGGVFGIIDHAGNEGADNESMHRIAKANVIDAAEAAGFTVEAESDLLASADDDHTSGVFDEGIRGRTDRFVLKLRKPAS